MGNQMMAVIKKDVRGLTANRRMLAALLIVPLVLTVLVPSIFVLALHFAPEQSEDLQKLLELLPVAEQAGDMDRTLAGLVLNYVMPVFFLIIPIMASAIMSASSFVGEKEKRTLETLLYCPLSLKQIFRAKVLASFLLSMAVSFLSFFAMVLVMETELSIVMGGMLLPDLKWLLVMLLLSPAVSLISITLIVRMSAKAQSMEDAQQGAVFLLLPVIMLLVGQLTGALLVSGWILLGLGLGCALLAFLLMKRAMGRFSYEALLS